MALAEAALDEDRLRRARDVLADFGTLWHDVAVPDVLREGAATEILERLDVRGSELVAVHPRPDENAWLLGYAYRGGTGTAGTGGSIVLIDAPGAHPARSPRSQPTMRSTPWRCRPTGWSGWSSGTARDRRR